MPDNITGRDGYIIGKALALALVALERLPYERQPKSDMEHMRELLSAGIDHGFTVSLHLAQAKCALSPDLDPIAVFRDYGLIDNDATP